MELSGKSLISIVFLMLVHDAVCTHFRGGTFTYKPVNPSDPANTTVSLISLENDSVLESFTNQVKCCSVAFGLNNSTSDGCLFILLDLDNENEPKIS